MGERNEAGAISLAIDDIFATAAATSSDAYTFRVDMVEIYNEELRDLLAPVAAKQKQAHSLQIKVRRRRTLIFLLPVPHACVPCAWCNEPGLLSALTKFAGRKAWLENSHAVWSSCMREHTCSEVRPRALPSTSPQYSMIRLTSDVSGL